MPYGESINRVDGWLKVTGGARYAGEVRLENAAHAALVESTIGNGRIVSVDTSEAEKAPGVVLVMTHRNAPRLAHVKNNPMHPGESYPLLQDDSIRYNGQHVGLVVAETFEQATYAASLVRVRYETRSAIARLEQNVQRAGVPKNFRGGSRPPDSKRGDPASVFSSAATAIDQTYTTPVEHHNPMEPHAVVAQWQDDGTLVLYHSTQAVFGSRESMAAFFGLPQEKVRVISSYVGGGFGCKGTAWPHVALTAMAAKMAHRPVKLILTRKQMFTSNGHRSKTIQRVRLACGQDGRLTAILHDGIVESAIFGEFVEPVGLPTEMMYSCPNVAVTHRVAAINTGMPTFMRAPGESTGMYALESAMDELSYAAGVDPVELRLRNYAEADEHAKKPWSSKSLRECYAQGVDAFGWKNRNPLLRSMRDGDTLIGWGMASATYPASASAASASIRLLADGSAVVRSGTQDIGTGTYTIMTQVAADTLGLPTARVRAELGDSLMPRAPVSGGSQTAASVMPAVRAAALDARKQVIDLAVKTDGPLRGTNGDDIEFRDGVLYRRGEAMPRDSLKDLMTRTRRESIDAVADNKPDAEKTYSLHAFGAHFVEVRVNPDLGEVRIGRYVGAFAAGRILNAKTARSQMIGGIVYGLGMALMEETEVDAGTARVVNANIAEYLVPVHADIPNIEILMIDEDDPHINSVGVKGIGELPMVGVAAAVANAVYHATGIRVRDLPIRPDKLMV